MLEDWYEKKKSAISSKFFVANFKKEFLKEDNSGLTGWSKIRQTTLSGVGIIERDNTEDAKRLEEEHKRSMLEVFNELDKNGDGDVTKAECIRA